MQTYGHGGDIYSIGRPVLDFSININLLGMPEEVKDAIRGHIDDYAAYPDTHCRALRAALGDAYGIDPACILCGNGASDLIFRLCRTVKPKETLVCAPTFSDYERDAVSAGSRVRRHLLLEDEGYAVTERILEDITDDTDLVFLCTPNNPTGLTVPNGLIRRIADRCREAGAYLLIDECFLCFTGKPSYLSVLGPEDTHVLVLNAFTKQYSMAGIRLGWIVSYDTELLADLEDAGPYWSVSTVAQTAGIAALGCGEWFRRSLEILAEERAWLTEQLRGLGITVFPGEANYLLLRGPGPEWTDLQARLLERDILIRSCANYHGLGPDFYRICVKEHSDNIVLINALSDIKNT